MKYTKYCLLFIFSFLCFYSVTLAKSQAFERNGYNGYLVNKNIMLSSKTSETEGTYAVDVKDKVYDFSEILTEEEENQLRDGLYEFIEQSNLDAAILIVDLNYGNDYSYDKYASNFYEYNEFGKNFEHHSGILFLRDANSLFPYFNIYVFGEAQLYYSEARIEKMLDKIYDSFSGYNSTGGYFTFVEQISIYYNKGIPSEMKHYFIDEDGNLVKEYVPPVLLSLGIAAIVTIIVISILVNKNKMVKKATKALDYLDVSSIVFTVKKDSFIRDSVSSFKIPTSSGGGGSRISSSGRGFTAGRGRRG